MVISALAIDNSYSATIQAADRLFIWLRPTEPDTCDALFDETFLALNQREGHALFKVFAKLTKICFRLLQHAKEEGLIRGQTQAEGDEQPREISKSYTEFTAEIDEILMCFVILCREVGDDHKQFEEFVTQIVDGEDFADTRLKTLLYVFNSEEQNSPFKAQLFKIVVEYAALTNYFDVAVFPVLADAINWVDTWPVPIALKRDIYFLVVGQLKETGKAAQSLAWAKEGLKTYDAEPVIEDIDTATKHAVSVLLQAIKLPNEFYFDKLMGMKAIRLLAQHPDYKSLFRIGEVLLHRCVSDLEKVFEESPDLIVKHDINVDSCMRKMRVIAVASEASVSTQSTDSAAGLSEHRTLNISDLAKVVGLSPEDTEEACVSAVGAGLFDAKMDQLNQAIQIE